MGNNRANWRNVGIFAHVDAGKTTTTEHMLYISGRTRTLGSVDTGTTITDSMEVERARGISVRAAMTALEWQGTHVQLVDTPGHVDFLSEVERALRVMDGAVLIVSAVEGVQAQTELIWNALRKLRIPTLIYINKMDRVGADPGAVLADIRSYLTADLLAVQRPLGSEQQFAGAEDLWAGGADAAARTALLEAIAERDERLLERYVSGEEMPLEQWRAEAAAKARRAEVYPVLYGASSKGIGVQALLDAMVEYLPAPGGETEAPPSGIVFKIERDKVMGRMAYIRLYQGKIRTVIPHPYAPLSASIIAVTHGGFILLLA